MYSTLLLAGSCTFVIGLVLYKIIRPKFSVKVNCWFCNNNTVVPYGNRNCWDCPHCDQYNGFSEDGDYNKSIPSQHDESLNFSTSKISPEQPSSSNANGFCRECNHKQEMKIKALASFETKDKLHNDSEVEAYKQHLDHVYKLCHRCELQLRQTLFKQDSHLRPKLLSWKLEQNLNFSSTSAFKYDSLLTKSKIEACSFHLRTLSLSLITFPFLEHLHTFEKHIPFVYHRVVHYVNNYIMGMNKYNHYLNGVGFFIFVLALLLDRARLKFIDGVAFLLWLSFLSKSIISHVIPTSIDLDCAWIIWALLTFLSVTLTLFSSRTTPKVYKFYKQKPSSATYEERNNCSTESFKDSSSSDDGMQYHEINPVLPKHTESLNTSLGAMSLGNSYTQASIRKQHEGVFVLQSYSTSKSHLITDASFKNISKANDFPRKRPLLSPPRFMPQKTYLPPKPRCNMNYWGFPYTMKRDHWIDNVNPYPGFYSYYQLPSPVYKNPSPFSSQGFVCPWSSAKGFGGFSSSLPTSRKGSICGDDRTSVYSEIQYTPCGMFTSDSPPPYCEVIKSNHSFDTASNSSHSSSTKCSASDSSNLNTSCDNDCQGQSKVSWKLKLMLVVSLSTNCVAIMYICSEYILPFLFNYFISKS